MIFSKRMGMQAEKTADEHREKTCKSEIFKKTAAAAVKAVLLCNGVKWAFAGGKKKKTSSVRRKMRQKDQKCKNKHQTKMLEEIRWAEC